MGRRFPRLTLPRYPGEGRPATLKPAAGLLKRRFETKERSHTEFGVLNPLEPRTKIEAPDGRNAWPQSLSLARRRSISRIRGLATHGLSQLMGQVRGIQPPHNGRLCMTCSGRKQGFEMGTRVCRIGHHDRMVSTDLGLRCLQLDDTTSKMF